MLVHKYNKGYEWRKSENLKGIVDGYFSLEGKYLYYL